MRTYAKTPASKIKEDLFTGSHLNNPSPHPLVNQNIRRRSGKRFSNVVKLWVVTYALRSDAVRDAVNHHRLDSTGPYIRLQKVTPKLDMKGLLTTTARERVLESPVRHIIHRNATFTLYKTGQ